MNKKLSQDRCTVTRATEDVIINCLKEDEASWENVFNIADSTLEREKLYYAKKKAKVEKKPFYVFRLNDKNMNGKPTFIFKSSRI